MNTNWIEEIEEEFEEVVTEAERRAMEDYARLWQKRLDELAARYPKLLQEVL